MYLEQIRPMQFRSSPAGFFSALYPLRQQHQTHLCQLQCSEQLQQPHVAFLQIYTAVEYSVMSTFLHAFSSVSLSESVSLLNTY